MSRMGEANTEEILTILRDEVNVEIDRKFSEYRRSISVGDKWCCRNMQEFAAQVWNANSPSADKSDFAVRYQFRGKDFVYCPFCGVKL